jgi:hypothetical protein
MDYTDINNDTLKRQYQNDINANNNYKPVQKPRQVPSQKPVQQPSQKPSQKSSSLKSKDIIQQLHPLVAKYYPFRHLYYSQECKNVIINEFVHALPVDEKQIIHKYARCKGLKQQTPEQKDIAKKYNLILRKLDRWYDKMGKDLYPELV